MEAKDWMTVVVALIAALIGAYGGYKGAIRAAGKANTQAYTDLITGVGKDWMESANPEIARIGAELVGGAFKAMAKDEDVPGEVRQAVENIGDLGAAEAEGRRILASGEDVVTELTDPEGDTSGQGPQGEPPAGQGRPS